MTTDFSGLLDRIREHCRQQRWFGPDGEHPSSSWSQHKVVYDTHTGQAHAYDPRADSRISGFAYPPASEEQLRITENALGFPLPPVLCALYTQVANGGFGPGYGLVGASGGFPSDDVRRAGVYLAEEHWGNDPTIAATLTVADWRIPASATRALRELPDCYLEDQSEPDGLVTLCHWGCSMYSELDLWTGHVYFAVPDIRQDVKYDPHTTPNDDDFVVGLQYEADSVEEWLEKWLAGTSAVSDAYVPIRLEDVDDLFNRIGEMRAAAKRREESSVRCLAAQHDAAGGEEP